MRGLMQSAVLRVLTYLPNFDPSRGKLENFLSLHILGQVKDNGRKTEGYSRHRKGRFHIFSLCATLPSHFTIRPFGDPSFVIHILKNPVF
jgi:hypothetical protein